MPMCPHYCCTKLVKEGIMLLLYRVWTMYQISARVPTTNHHTFSACAWSSLLVATNKGFLLDTISCTKVQHSLLWRKVLFSKDKILPWHLESPTVRGLIKQLTINKSKETWIWITTSFYSLNSLQYKKHCIDNLPSSLVIHDIFISQNILTPHHDFFRDYLKDKVIYIYIKFKCIISIK